MGNREAEIWERLGEETMAVRRVDKFGDGIRGGNLGVGREGEDGAIA